MLATLLFKHSVPHYCFLFLFFSHPPATPFCTSTVCLITYFNGLIILIAHCELYAVKTFCSTLLPLLFPPTHFWTDSVCLTTYSDGRIVLIACCELYAHPPFWNLIFRGLCCPALLCSVVLLLCFTFSWCSLPHSFTQFPQLPLRFDQQVRKLRGMLTLRLKEGVCVYSVCSVCVCVWKRERKEREPPGLMKDVEELVCVYVWSTRCVRQTEQLWYFTLHSSGYIPTGYDDTKRLWFCENINIQWYLLWYQVVTTEVKEVLYFFHFFFPLRFMYCFLYMLIGMGVGGLL